MRHQTNIANIITDVANQEVTRNRRAIKGQWGRQLVFELVGRKMNTARTRASVARNVLRDHGYEDVMIKVRPPEMDEGHPALLAFIPKQYEEDDSKWGESATKKRRNVKDFVSEKRQRGRPRKEGEEEEEVTGRRGRGPEKLPPDTDFIDEEEVEEAEAEAVEPEEEWEEEVEEAEAEPAPRSRRRAANNNGGNSRTTTRRRSSRK